jgi:hypothetical protein
MYARGAPRSVAVGIHGRIYAQVTPVTNAKAAHTSNGRNDQFMFVLAPDGKSVLQTWPTSSSSSSSSSLSSSSVRPRFSSKSIGGVAVSGDLGAVFTVERTECVVRALDGVELQRFPIAGSVGGRSGGGVGGGVDNVGGSSSGDGGGGVGIVDTASVAVWHVPGRGGVVFVTSADDVSAYTFA